MELAPIALFVYKRLWHTQQTVEALQKNELSEASKLFIFSDGPKSEADKKDVQTVRDYVETITGFSSVTVIERERNIGLAQSIITGVTDIVNKYGRIIVLEDDMVSSPHFLKFMNEALEFYKDEERVICIHGYIYPLKAQLPETFFLRGADCWGWGTWKRGWDLFESDGEKLLEEITSKGIQKTFDFNGAYPYTKMLQDQIKRKYDSWAIRWYASAFLRDKLTLYPGKSLIQNIGFDESGTHCSTSDAYYTQLAMGPLVLRKIPVEENKLSKEELEKYFKSLKSGFIDRVISKLFH